MIDFFQREKLTEEEKKEKKLKRKRISLENLYIVQVGINDESGYPKVFHPNEFALVKYHQKTCSSDSYFQDIFTETKYYLFDNYHVNHGQQCCNMAVPFITTLKDSDYKYQILQDGFITKYDAIQIITFLNGRQQNQITASQDKPEVSNERKPSNQKQQSSNNTKASHLTEGKRLNDKVYPHEPAIGREMELKSVLTTLASQKKSPILVGESGTGKTAIVDELVYKIQRDEVPDFLRGKEVIELDTSSIVAGTKYSGTLEEKFKNIINYASNQNALLFIDEIHTIYGAGATSNDDNDIAEMLKKVIDRENIRVIGTTTSDEYDTYFSKDALKRRFEPIIVKEPNKEILAMIIEKTFYDYGEDSNISLETIEDRLNSIIDVLIETTLPNCRKYHDSVSNPDLVISIIDKSFADAKMNNQTYINIENIIYGVSTCSRIYESVQERIISELKSLKGKVKKQVISESSIISFRN